MLSRGQGASRRGATSRSRRRRREDNPPAPRRSALVGPVQKVVINVSGLRFVTTMATLETYPDSLLGDNRRRKWYYDANKNEYFFDRHRPSFEAILQYYQTGGVLQRPEEVPAEVFLDELEFYDVGEETLQRYKEEEGMELPPPELLPPPEDERLKKIWLLFNEPKSSILAQIVTSICVVMILMSVVVTCMETMPEVQQWLHTPTNGSGGTAYLPVTKNPFFVAETIYVAWFTLELVLGFVTCSDRCRFVKDYVNVLDFIGIVLYFAELGMEVTSSHPTDQINRIVSAMWIARLVRMLRIVKVTRYSGDMQLFWKAMTNSMTAIILFFFMTTVLMVLFSCVVYYTEIDDPDTKFTSIPETFWWAIVTMINIGYGDYYPRTIVGKIVGSIAAIAGIVALCLGIPEFMECYIHLYEAARYHKRYSQRKNFDMASSKFGALGSSKAARKRNLSRNRDKNRTFKLVL
ncbi:PREDICTED: potassium voltage-gated channel subfamily A member 10-like [Branchiostoma belcheri]|uniref:Potassium voltage-gated channel subfamily A member 10-like n=1 Tax=Branchiostoma belcheri TaxID=7741 RepID=A0A6P4YKM3_BRABE|nr:PREDICTED: potassium voltage-gated channel subfamily A member 10-like [Branchiostoma belcheri]